MSFKSALGGWQKRIFGSSEDEQLPSIADLSDPKTQQALSAVMVHDLLRERRSERRWKTVKRTMFTTLGLLGIGYYVVIYANVSGISFSRASGDLVGVVRLEGEMSAKSGASADKVIPALRKAFSDKGVKAVILAIDSPGGSPLEAERINFVLSSLSKEHKKPVYAVIQGLGASAGYMVAMHTDKIYSGRYSLVGSIGAVMSSWDVHEAINKYGVTQQVFASGNLKSMLNPFVEATPEARQKATDLVTLAGGLFVEELREHRGERLKSNFKYDTGEVWGGTEALKIGLVDQVATIEEVALDLGAEIKEFGPGRRTVTPFSASVGSGLTDWLQSMLSNSITSAISERATPRLQ